MLYKICFIFVNLNLLSILERTRSGSKPVTLISALQNKYSTSSMKSTHCQIFITSKAPGKTGMYCMHSFLYLPTYILNLLKLCSSWLSKLSTSQQTASVWELKLVTPEFQNLVCLLSAFELSKFVTEFVCLLGLGKEKEYLV